MAREQHVDGSPFSEDFSVGDDGDMPGRALPLSVDEIDDILQSPSMPIADRRRILAAALADLEERGSLDRIDSHRGIRARLRDALNYLDAGTEGEGGGDFPGLDTDGRLNQPDEILERFQEERDE